MPIEIRVDLAVVKAKPPLRALADVTLRWDEGELTIRRCAVFEKPGEPAWASLPRLPVEKNGKRVGRVYRVGPWVLPIPFPCSFEPLFGFPKKLHGFF